MKTIHPFMMAETVLPVAPEDALTTGLIPLITESVNPREALRAYVAVYLKEEVQLEAMVRNIGAFSRFLEAILAQR